MNVWRGVLWSFRPRIEFLDFGILAAAAHCNFGPSGKLAGQKLGDLDYRFQVRQVWANQFLAHLWDGPVLLAPLAKACKKSSGDSAESCDEGANTDGRTQQILTLDG